MEVTNIRYLSQDGYPILEMEIDGRPCRLGTDKKPTLIENGILVLGEGFEDLPTIELEVDGEKVSIGSATRDRNVLEAWTQFAQAAADGSFKAEA